MFRVYKKVEKSHECPSGYMEIDPTTIEKPFLMCVSAQDLYEKSVFGTIREGARAARLYTTKEIGAGFRIDDFPIDFLGFRFKGEKTEDANYYSLVDNFLYPFLIGDDSRSIEELKKRARMINFMTFCDGTKTYKKAEAYLEAKMREKGYYQIDIDSILSQISHVSIGTAEITSEIKATSINLIDINDEEIENRRTPQYINALKEQQKDSIFGIDGSGKNTVYLYNGTGNHSIVEYLNDGVKVKPALCGVISYLLSNSIKNYNTEELLPISQDDIITVFRTYARNAEDPNELLTKLDNNIIYDGASKYSSEEIPLILKMDKACKKLALLESKVQSYENKAEEYRIKLETLQSSIGKYSSSVTLLQILTDSGLYQPTGVNPFESKSDKEIREEYEKSSGNILK